MDTFTLYKFKINITESLQNSNELLLNLLQNYNDEDKMLVIFYRYSSFAPQPEYEPSYQERFQYYLNLANQINILSNNLYTENEILLYVHYAMGYKFTEAKDKEILLSELEQIVNFTPLRENEKFIIYKLKHRILSLYAQRSWKYQDMKILLKDLENSYEYFSNYEAQFTTRFNEIEGN